ncbi:XTP/dITP diphosphohydrolase [Mumia flava]|uniref:XTP/dITP diphosphohydrolase n=1 Tax=Mumia flava TaxID=1348852 RepID=A0A0B2BKV4_9ACTN|nr:MazG family protein [Mumia flava]PJJ56847.1 XTP/dITP diphosphohydrolase [Mumia flava]
MKILVTSPRVAPGLLTYAAWRALDAATDVVAIDEDDPTYQALVAAGLPVRVVTDPLVAQPDTGGDAGTVWLAPAGDVDWARDLASRLVASGTQTDEIEVVFGSYDVPGARLLDLVEVMDRLRLECPWTREQTHASLQQYLLEEAYEVLDALDRGATDELREELGDLLMQVVFHAAVAAGRGPTDDGWDIDDVAAGIVEKLVRRNPHVFGDVDVADAAEVDANWQRLKATEKPRASVLDGIAPTLPALAYADKVVSRLERDGAPVSADGDALADRLLALVLQARAEGRDAEQELRRRVNELVAGR